MVFSEKASEKSPYETAFFHDILRSKEFSMWCNHQDIKSYEDYSELFLSKLNIDVDVLMAVPEDCYYQPHTAQTEKNGSFFSYEIQEYTVQWVMSEYLSIEVLFIHNKALYYCARFSINKYNSLYVVYEPVKRIITETYIRNVSK
jgi:hypothetical protein